MTKNAFTSKIIPLMQTTMRHTSVWGSVMEIIQQTLKAGHCECFDLRFYTNWVKLTINNWSCPLACNMLMAVLGLALLLSVCTLGEKYVFSMFEKISMNSMKTLLLLKQFKSLGLYLSCSFLWLQQCALGHIFNCIVSSLRFLMLRPAVCPVRRHALPEKTELSLWICSQILGLSEFEINK